jgi:hypothetical protein
MNASDRRTFLHRAASGVFAAGGLVNLNPGALGANETVSLALIGARNQGRAVALRSIAAGARIKTLCDIDDAVAAKVSPDLEKAQGRAPDYVKNFLESIKSRRNPNADIEIGRLSTTLCHLGNIACRLKRGVRFDPATETFPGDEAANALLSKPYRPAYPLPAV